MALPQFKEFPIKTPLGGLVKDFLPRDIPPGSWAEHNNFHVFDGRIRKYGGYEILTPLGGSDDITGDIIFGYEWVKDNLTRRFIVGTVTELFLVDLVSGEITSIQNSYIGERWQPAVINDRLMLANGEDPIQEVAGDASTAAPLVGDAALPDTAKYLLNNTNHLVAGYTTEGGQGKPYRVRWSDIDDPETWVRTSVNEPGFLDIDRGQVMGLANLGTFGFFVFSDVDIWRFDYVGLPFIYSKTRVVTDIGLIAPYSLVTWEDKHFFLGTNGFYEFDGSSQPRLIGKDKVDNYFLANIDATDPGFIFGFAHPIYPEIWWVYKTKDSEVFNRMLVYNWEDGVWAERNPFYHSMLASATLSTGLVWEDATFEWDSVEADATWASFSTIGANIIVGAFEDDIFLHDETVKTANGAAIAGHLLSGDIGGKQISDKLNSNIWLRLSRLYYDINLEADTAAPIVQSKIYSKTKPIENLTLLSTTVLDDDFRHDFRFIDKIFTVELITNELLSLNDFSVIGETAGARA